LCCPPKPFNGEIPLASSGPLALALSAASRRRRRRLSITLSAAWWWRRREWPWERAPKRRAYQFARSQHRRPHGSSRLEGRLCEIWRCQRRLRAHRLQHQVRRALLFDTSSPLSSVLSIGSCCKLFCCSHLVRAKARGLFACGRSRDTVHKFEEEARTRKERRNKKLREPIGSGTRERTQASRIS